MNYAIARPKKSLLLVKNMLAGVIRITIFCGRVEVAAVQPPPIPARPTLRTARTARSGHPCRSRYLAADDPLARRPRGPRTAERSTPCFRHGARSFRIAALNRHGGVRPPVGSGEAGEAGFTRNQSPYSVDSRVFTALGWVCFRPDHSSRTTGRPSRGRPFRVPRRRPSPTVRPFYPETGPRDPKMLYGWGLRAQAYLRWVTTLSLVLRVLALVRARIPLALASCEFSRRDRQRLRCERCEASMWRALTLDVGWKLRKQFFSCHVASWVPTC